MSFSSEEGNSRSLYVNYYVNSICKEEGNNLSGMREKK